MNFAQFMAAALYDNEHGYYRQKIRTVGRTGDFSTSVDAGPLLGRALARWAGNKRRLLPGRRWHLIEIGGGTGELAATILRALGWLGRIGLTYHLVEISHPLREHQQEKLRGHRVVWHDSLTAALEAARGAALIFSNELVDAYPCRRFRRTGTQWEEIGLTNQSGALVEAARPSSATEIARMGSSVISLPSANQAQCVEVHENYREEITRAASHWRQGCWLTIDYGDTFPALYHRQPSGTVRGYFHHLRVEGPDLYTRMGRQDLTADVNFTDLQNWGAEVGFQNDRLETQREFILRWLGPTVSTTTGESRVLDPIGAGTAFKVLQQSRNLPPSGPGGSIPAR